VVRPDSDAPAARPQVNRRFPRFAQDRLFGFASATVWSCQGGFMEKDGKR
jgi:hypothetical protein